MEYHILARKRHIRAPRPREPIITTRKQIASLRKTPRRTLTRRIRNRIRIRAVAPAAVEKHIRPVRGADHGGRLDVRALAAVVGHELRRRPCLRHAVARHGLDHQRCRDDGCDTVVAHAAVPERVAVDFVQHVARAVGFAEARGVDCAALVCGAHEGRV